ncbi:MAG: FadR family transcriptional regulator [Ruminococcaceae bacterium]|nr:FadR family transcriptional regulator [Oscillospiraceae bacterium]
MAERKTRNLTDQTADQLFQLITSHPDLGPGTRLPAEAELCAMFGVSRTTLREAVRSLAVQGYVEVRHGKGTFVCDRTNIRQDIGLSLLESVQVRLQDLFEIRLMIEPNTAMLACRRGTDEEIAHIIHCADVVAEQIQSGGDWDSADLDFHHAFVAACHNQFMEQLVPILNRAVTSTWRMVGTYPSLPEMVLRDNELIVGFLKARDAQGTRLAMEAHLRHVIRILDFGEKEVLADL